MDYVNSDKLIFVLASPAGGGYRLARIICCLDNVHWYDSKGNGMYPWSVIRKDPNNISPTPAKVKGRRISKFHFDRRLASGMIPLLGERIEKFWDVTDLDIFYKENWNREFISSGGGELIDKGISILWVLHDVPADLETKFPNAKIINLLDDDVYAVINRYLTTTALFPFKIENTNIKPKVDNQVSKILLELESLNPNPTYRDYWAWTIKGTAYYNTEFDDEYVKYVSDLIICRHNTVQAAKENPKHLTVTWDTLDIESIRKFLNAEAVDPNYIKLINC